jgi:hypothetical protein
VSEHPYKAIMAVVSPEAIEAGEPQHAVDVLLVAGQLEVAIGKRPAPTAISGRSPRPTWMTRREF